MSDEPEPEPPAVQVDHADNVNVPPAGGELPHSRAIIAVSFLILLGFGAVTVFVLLAGEETGIEAATKGSIIQTWNNLAIAAGAFWLGSSLAGKMGSGGGGGGGSRS